MIIASVSLAALLAQCAPQVSPDTMAAIVQTESEGNPWAIGVNGAAGVRQPSSQDEAIRVARDLIARGRNIDMGLAQINSANLSWLKLSVEQVFDPCNNLRAGAFILTDNYRRAVSTGIERPLHAALSAYNTGSFTRGLRNGYVAKVMRNGGQGALTLAPTAPVLIQGDDAPLEASEAIALASAPQVEEVPARPPAWDVFGKAAWERKYADANQVGKEISYE